jgi:hypothetical protein
MMALYLETMETPIQKLLNELKHNLNGANFMRMHDDLSQLEKNWHNAQIKTLTDIILDVEVNFLSEEKKQIQVAFDFGYKYGIEGNSFQNSETFFNDMYPQSCSKAII